MGFPAHRHHRWQLCHLVAGQWRCTHLPLRGRSPPGIDVTAYTARLRGTILDLTYKEFELLKFLAANRGRVLTRDALLHEVWGEDYIGGSRTVDVHIRRLRAKLGTEHDNLIGTVRNVGYRLDAPEDA